MRNQSHGALSATRVALQQFWEVELYCSHGLLSQAKTDVSNQIHHTYPCVFPPKQNQTLEKRKMKMSLKNPKSRVFLATKEINTPEKNYYY